MFLNKFKYAQLNRVVNSAQERYLLCRIPEYFGRELHRHDYKQMLYEKYKSIKDFIYSTVSVVAKLERQW